MPLFITGSLLFQDRATESHEDNSQDFAFCSTTLRSQEMFPGPVPSEQTVHIGIDSAVD